MTTKIALATALKDIPRLEVAALESYLRGRYTLVKYLGPYGFTSTNFMVRGMQVSVFGLAEPVSARKLLAYFDNEEAQGQ